MQQALVDAAWPGMAVEDAKLAVQISSLRRVLDEDRTGGSCIQTVIGRGYRFLPSVAAESPPGVQTTAADSRASYKTVEQPSVSSTARPHRPSPVVVALATTLIAIGVGSGALMAWEMWFSRGHTPASALPSLSLVVLPFDNLGGEPDDDYLVAGVTDDLTTALSHIPGTFVISRATAYSYRGKAEDIRRIGRDLGIRYVVRRSVRGFGHTLRVNVELSSTETGAQLWSDGFDQKVADLASGQEQIVIRMRAALNISLADTEAARSLRERPTNPDAFDFILQARAVMLRPQTKDTVAQAVGLFQQALSRDPNAVLALVGAMGAVLDENYLSGLSSEVADARLDAAEQYLGRAKMLAPNSEGVLVAQAYMVE
jgi:TolB-like protein